ncbi:MAG TPA: DEAD/DEAH box helicase, partial [Candidatus Saccharimonadales bacterium]|nr:DEAD/DEAH box helicase [Candidatus Saccharimonadales bacterium]
MTKLYSVAFPTKNKFEGTSTFVYSSENTLNLGDLVLCPFGKKSSLGLVVELNPPRPKFKFKNIEEVVHKNFINSNKIELYKWIVEYYLSSPGVTLELFCTTNLINRVINNTDQKWLDNRINQILLESKVNNKISLNKLNGQQSSALENILDNTNKKSSFVLHGATGSGKTEVYLHSTLEFIKNKKSVLVLVPEIGLTTQNIARFETLGVPLITLHSNQTSVVRAKNWQLISKLTLEDKPVIVLGPRSAMFSPIHNLGLTIIDEFHDQSYRQDSSPRYNSVIVGGMLSRLTDSKLILGSATPNVSDLYTLTQKDVPILELDIRDTQTKEIFIIDSRDKDKFSKSKIIST